MTGPKDKDWITPDFEIRFREAMGRDMTQQEREFFGLKDQSTSRADNSTRDKSNSDNTQFAWQALRRISALLG
jgi:hypothetical protein